MTDKEYTGIAVGKDQMNSEYIILDGIVKPGGFVADHETQILRRIAL